MLIKIASLLFVLYFFISSVPAHSAVFNVSSGDVTGLIAAINTANANGEENTINLEAGLYILTSINNSADPGGTGDANGLPVITNVIAINGDSAEKAIIERAVDARQFRIFDVANTGKLTMSGLTVRGGQLALGAGGAIRNQGDLTINRSIIERNSVGLAGGGAIFNSGRLIIERSIIRRSGGQACGGILNSGIATVLNSTISLNNAFLAGGVCNSPPGNPTFTIHNSTISDNRSGTEAGGVLNGPGTMVITNTTIANNGSESGGILNRSNGNLKIANSTISGNDTDGLSRPAGIANSGGNVELQNTIVALNAVADCSGSITSLGNNIIGDPTGCDITLQPSDRTGDPGLGAFVDSGAPGTGRFPLLATSAAIDAGNASACPATDQLETPRRGRCDIGAVEFYPVVNGLVALANVKTDFDPTPVPNGPAGTFRITSEFTNTGTQAIGNRFAEVVELAEGNLLLNADHGAGGVGARLTSVDSTSKLLLPGATETFEFIIGLQTQEPFTFFVNMLGDPQTSNTF